MAAREDPGGEEVAQVRLLKCVANQNCPVLYFLGCREVSEMRKCDRLSITNGISSKNSFLMVY